MNDLHSAIGKRLVINTNLFYEDFIATFDLATWEDLDESLAKLVDFSKNLEKYDDSATEEMKNLSNATDRLREDFITGNKDSVEGRHQLDRIVKSVVDNLVKRFGGV